jgi:flagellar basal-body rod modification protein FlgD
MASVGFNPAAASNAADTVTQGTTQSKDQVASKEQFLQLLVAQIKNQDPLNPADGVQFLTQLAQFSELEQMMAIRAELATLNSKVQEPETQTEQAQ